MFQQSRLQVETFKTRATFSHGETCTSTQCPREVGTGLQMPKPTRPSV